MIDLTKPIKVQKHHVYLPIFGTEADTIHCGFHIPGITEAVVSRKWTTVDERNRLVEGATAKTEAYRRLFEAAPKMLVALKGEVEYLQFGEDNQDEEGFRFPEPDYHPGERADRLRALIAEIEADPRPQSSN